MKIFSLLSLLVFSTPALSFAAAPDTVYAFKAKSIVGKPVPLAQYQGKVLLIVNTASHCGFTPQYEGLQALYKEYKAQGLEILAFPSNDFGQQEPGAPKEIKNFCETKYKVTFPLFDKGVVLGPHKQALFDWLITHEPDAGKLPSEIEWNFEKFLISREGKVVARYRSKVTPLDDSVKSAIEAQLKLPVPAAAPKK